MKMNKTIKEKVQEAFQEIKNMLEEKGGFIIINRPFESRYFTVKSPITHTPICMITLVYDESKSEIVYVVESDIPLRGMTIHSANVLLLVNEIDKHLEMLSMGYSEDDEINTVNEYEDYIAWI